MSSCRLAVAVKHCKHRGKLCYAIDLRCMDAISILVAWAEYLDASIGWP